jgi:hypothetical protein
VSQMDRAGEGHATSRLRPIDGRDQSLIDRYAVGPLTPNYSAHRIWVRFYKLRGVSNG